MCGVWGEVTDYTHPPSEMRCNQCQRTGRAGERPYDTCGDPIRKRFIPFHQMPKSTVADVQRHSDENMRTEYCLGMLLCPVLVD